MNSTAKQSARHCELCDRPIAAQRLAALPGAMRCVACQAEVERQSPIDIGDLAVDWSRLATLESVE